MWLQSWKRSPVCDKDELRQKEKEEERPRSLKANHNGLPKSIPTLSGTLWFPSFLRAVKMHRELHSLALDKVRNFRILNRAFLPRSSDGVVVIGFIARRHDDSAQLLNRVIDFNAFASGNLDVPLLVDDEESKEWFERRRMNYFHDHDKGIFSLPLAVSRFTSPGFDSAVEEHEFGDLQGMLFMFSAPSALHQEREDNSQGDDTAFEKQSALFALAVSDIREFAFAKKDFNLAKHPEIDAELQIQREVEEVGGLEKLEKEISRRARSQNS
ncbi:hypothetical protein JHK82_052747 [Glycine max]|nr:hypothetical protein JHK85_053446 [Glycine max]KAG5085350.1 hypothetical protein JHK82_052747 [Glycine max]